MTDLTVQASSLRVGYLLRTFPILSETFVTGEIRGIGERTGVMPYVCSLYRPAPENAGGWDVESDGPVTWFRDLDKSGIPKMLGYHTGKFFRQPFRQWRYWQGCESGLSKSDKCKLAVIAMEVQRAGIQHMHTHFAWEHVDYLYALKLLTGIPFSVTVHAADIFIDPEAACRRLQAAAFVTTISEYNRKLLIERFSLPQDRVHVVRCGIDMPDIVSGDSSEPAVTDGVVHAMKSDNLPLKILSVGRMVEKKGFDSLLEALRRLREQEIAFEAEIVGNGPLQSELERQADEAGLQDCVRFAGALPSERVLERVRACDVFALCCREAANGDMDGIPVVLMEAMACGKPVVSSRISGIPELVDGQCGFLADPEDAATVAAYFSRLTDDRELGRRMGRAGQDKIRKQYLRSRQIEDLLRLIVGMQEDC